METRIIPWGEDIWFSPAFAIQELQRKMDSLGIVDAEKEIDSNRALKKYKEAWVGAMALLVYSQYDKGEWWLQIPKQDPPDVIGMRFIPNPKKGNDMLLTQFEVFEIRDESETIEQSIDRKLGNKDYSQTYLIGYLRRKGDFDFKKVSDYFQSKEIRAWGLYILTFLPDGTGVLVQLTRGRDQTQLRFNPRQLLEQDTQKAFMNVVRGMTNTREPLIVDGTPTLIPE